MAIVVNVVGSEIVGAPDNYCWANQRKIFGKTLIEHQVIQNKLAYAATSLEYDSIVGDGDLRHVPGEGRCRARPLGRAHRIAQVSDARLCHRGFVESLGAGWGIYVTQLLEGDKWGDLAMSEPFAGRNVTTLHCREGARREVRHEVAYRGHVCLVNRRRDGLGPPL